MKELGLWSVELRDRATGWWLRPWVEDEVGEQRGENRGGEKAGSERRWLQSDLEATGDCSSQGSEWV